jgi:plasmid replication initiation protein
MGDREVINMYDETKPLVFNQLNLVSKSNSLVEARYKLGTMEQKVIAAIASNISPDDKDFQTYTFSIKEFKELIGSKSKNIYHEIDKVMTKLMQPFNFINAEGKPTKIAWLSKATYNVGEGTVTVRFDPDLKPFFLFLNEKFTRYKLGNIIHLRRSYSIRIYELLKSYEGLAERTFTLEELRSKLGVENKYPHWINFRQRVLDPAQEELEEKTDIMFTYEPIKKGRSIEKVKFIIKPNPKNKTLMTNIVEQLEKVLENEDVLEIQEKGKELGLTLPKKLVQEWLKYGKETVMELMESIQYRDDIENKIGYISSVLRRKAESEEKMADVDQVQKKIREVIHYFTPRQGARKVDLLPEWLVKSTAVDIFAKDMAPEEAEQLWEEKRDEIMEEINNRRLKMTT